VRSTAIAIVVCNWSRVSVCSFGVVHAFVFSQKQACMAIRNLVARTRHHAQAFINNGAEAIIRKARNDHKQGECLRCVHGGWTSANQDYTFQN